VIDKEISDGIRKKVKAVVEERGLDLVDFKIFPKGRSWVIRSIVDYPSGGVTMEECALLNKIIFSIMEEDNMLGDDFVVEVNSPGLDRPLKDIKDFIRCRGKLVCVWLKESLREKTYIEGEITEVMEDAFLLKVKNDIFEIPFNIVTTVKQKIM